MPSPTSRSLPYHADSELYMRALNEFAMPAFLDSANHGGENGSRDILAAAPAAYLQVERGLFSCSDNLKTRLGDSPEAREFIYYIRQLKQQFLPLLETVSRPTEIAEYTGSLIGYLGYPTLNGKSEIAIVDAFVGVYLWAIVVDHRLRRCDLRYHPGCSAEFIEGLHADLHEALVTAASTEAARFSVESELVNGTSLSDYQKAFAEIKSHIDSGDCYQVNLTQSFTTQGHGEPLAAYLRLRGAATAPFSAYFGWNDGALLSLSPERFLRVQQGTVLTQPIKGTRPRGKTAASDRRLADELSSSEKDRAENLMIVDLMRNDLGRVCETGSIEVNQLFSIESFSNVHHLISDIGGTLRADKDALDLLAACYPGGSITGAPKLSAMQIIQEVECDPRRVYCGTVFNLGADGSLDSSITIRSLLWESGVLHCWAGGGIVADSDCEQEYQECFDKIDNIFSVLKSLS